MKLSIIIPVYNEKNTVLEILKRVDTVVLNVDKEIIIVDDGSIDGATDILKSLDKNKYKVILKNRNEGKGAALKKGLEHATGDFVIFQDADLEYSPKDYPALLAPLERGEADMVIGSRVWSKPMRLFGPRRVLPITYFGLKLTTFSINLLYGRKGTDYYGCYKAIRREVLESVLVRANGFDYDSELLCKLFKRGIKTIEVPISFQPRNYRTSKKISWLDGFNILYSIIWWRFQD